VNNVICLVNNFIDMEIRIWRPCENNICILVRSNYKLKNMDIGCKLIVKFVRLPVRVQKAESCGKILMKFEIA
jgi:hypothetical protein